MEALSDYGPVLALLIGTLGIAITNLVMTIRLGAKIDERFDALVLKIDALDAGSRGRDGRILDRLEATPRDGGESRN